MANEGRTKRSTELHRRRQRRAVALTRAILGGENVETEVPIPESTRFVDIVGRLGGPSPAWGVLQGDLAHRRVLVEHFSRPPSPEELGTTLVEAAWGVEQWLKRRWREPRPPLTLILSVGRPQQALDFFRMLAPDAPRGLYRTLEPGLEVMLVDVRGLDRSAPGTELLALYDHRREVASANLRRLFASRAVDTITKENIGAAIMSEPKVFDPREYRLTFEEVKALGRDEGREEGREEGRLAEARRLLLRQLRRRSRGALPARLLAGLEACRDVTRLERALDAVVDARTQKERLQLASEVLEVDDL